MGTTKIYKVPTEVFHIDFGGPIYNEQNHEVYFLECKDSFSDFPIAEVIDRANAPKIF